jgi:hypothetical protein
MKLPMWSQISKGNSTGIALKVVEEAYTITARGRDNRFQNGFNVEY